MFKNIGAKWNSFRSTVNDNTTTNRAIVWAVGVGAVLIIIISKWLAGLIELVGIKKEPIVKILEPEPVAESAVMSLYVFLRSI